MTTLKSFLKEVGGNEEDIISYSWEEAMKKVKRNWYDLRYIKEQTEEMCIEAVKQEWDALKFVDKTIFNTDIKEYTMEDLQEKLWEDFKLIK